MVELIAGQIILYGLVMFLLGIAFWQAFIWVGLSDWKD